MTKSTFDWRTWFGIGFLGIGEGSIYFLPYIRNVYYTPMLNIMHVTNADMGWLMTFFAIGCMVMYIPGGIITDNWDFKKCITISLAATGILVGTFAFFINYRYAEIVWILLAFTTTFVFWTSTIKAARMMAPKEQQGRVYSIFYAVNGASAVLVQTISLAIFQHIPNTVVGLRVVLLINSAVLFLCAIMCQILIPNKKEMAKRLAEEGEASKFNWRDVGKVLANPLIWLIVIVMFCVYGVYTNVYWFSNYLTEVKKMSNNTGEILGLIRNTYMMFVCSLLGSIAVGAFKKRSTYIGICTIGTAVTCFLFLILHNTGATALGIISLFPSAFMLLCYGVVYSLFEEYKVPVAIAGTAIGIVSILGYTPDLLFGTILGGFVDRAQATGNVAAGYMHIFIFFGILGIIGAVAAFLGLYLIKKKTSSSKKTVVESQNRGAYV